MNNMQKVYLVRGYPMVNIYECLFLDTVNDIHHKDICSLLYMDNIHNLSEQEIEQNIKTEKYQEMLGKKNEIFSNAKKACNLWLNCNNKLIKQYEEIIKGNI